MPPLKVLHVSWKPAQQDEAQAEAQPQGRITRPVSDRAHQGGGEVSQARQHCPRTSKCVCVCVCVWRVPMRYGIPLSDE